MFDLNPDHRGHEQRAFGSAAIVYNKRLELLLNPYPQRTLTRNRYQTIEFGLETTKIKSYV